MKNSSLPLKNKLGAEKGLYLRQHAENPVAWQCWEESTFSLAKELGRPLFISIGYAACHWCHVMERESFTDTAVADVLNKYFIPIKIDREERPEIDALYIHAAQLMGVQGGWPLSVFADEKGHPFYIGTYYPSQSRYNMPSFIELLKLISNYWEEKREELGLQSQKLAAALERTLRPASFNQTEGGGEEGIKESIDKEFFGEDKIYGDLQKEYFDQDFGGFKVHPLNKFPPSMNLQLLMRIGFREGDEELIAMSEKTLEGMYSGGIYDHLRGGIARYSTDYEWKIPHFEKMLYDNALFIEVLTDAYLVTQKDYYLSWAMETADYVLDELEAPTGGFMSSQDADSEGVEGKYFLWSIDELMEVLNAKEFDFFRKVFNIQEAGNFEGSNILYFNEFYTNLRKTVLKDSVACETLSKIKQKLLKVRYKRKAPLTDEKILVSWNGLMISALARLGRVASAVGVFSGGSSCYKRGESYLKSAERAFLFIKQVLFNQEEQVLYRRYIGGEIRYHGLLSDYVNFAAGGLELYESTFKEIYRETAEMILRLVIEFFQDGKGLFYEQDKRVPFFMTRYSDHYDDTEPAGNSKLVEVLVKLAAYKGAAEYEVLAEQIFTLHKKHLEQDALPYMLRVLHDYRLGMRTLTFQGGSRAKLHSFLEGVWKCYEPGLLVQQGNEHSKRQSVEAVLCMGKKCLAPIREVSELLEVLKRKDFK